MKNYTGIKRVTARPMTRGDYNRYQGYPGLAGEDPQEKGYLVEHADGGKPNNPMHAGFISWVRADLFDSNYVEAQP